MQRSVQKNLLRHGTSEGELSIYLLHACTDYKLAIEITVNSNLVNAISMVVTPSQPGSKQLS